MKNKYSSSMLLVVIIIFNFCIGCNKSDNVVIHEITTLEAEPIRSGLLFECLSIMNKKEVLVMAHRGYHIDVPENSLPSITKAIEKNIDFIEVDVRTTSDSVLVLLHDKTIDRTTNGSGAIKELRIEDTKKNHLKFNNKLTEYFIPTLEEALKITKDKIFVDLDIKSASLRQVYDLVKKLEMLDNVIFTLWKKEEVSRMLDYDSKAQVFPVAVDSYDIGYYVKNVQPLILHFRKNNFNDELISLAKKKQVKVFIGILGDVDKSWKHGNDEPLNDIINKGVEIIQTDYPVKLIDYLRAKRMHN